jgi:drug/metabolite transporter (DMT)-like permease
MNLAWALASALAYGVSDFAGGFASRQHTAFRVILFSYPISAIFVLVVCPIFGGDLTLNALLLSAGSGGAMAVAIWWFYAALAQGPMSIVSPITSVLVAGLPVLAGLLIGETMTQLVGVGVFLAFVAVFFVSRQKSSGNEEANDNNPRFTRSVFLLTVGAGTAFAASFMFAHQIPSGSGLWPVFTARLVATFLILLVCKKPINQFTSASRGLVVYSVGIGLLDAIANSAMYFALQNGQLSTNSVVISLYPVFTVFLAVVVAKEKISRMQCVGLFLALVSIVTISYGN